jgi:RNA polymerase sigma-70 factor (ECF subfamily)
MVMTAVAADGDLIDRCIAGETQAWRELHRAYHGQVVRLLNRLGLPPAEVEDASQEVFVRVFRALARFEKRADLGTWVYRIVVNEAVRYRRSRVPRLLRWLVPEPPEVAGSGPELSESEAARRVRRALAELTPAHRIALVLYEFEGLSGEQIARVTDSPVATVWRRLHYARREFESWFREGPMEGKSR